MDREEREPRKCGGQQRVQAADAGVSGTSSDPVREQFFAYGYVRGRPSLRHQHQLQRQQQQQQREQPRGNREQQQQRRKLWQRTNDLHRREKRSLEGDGTSTQESDNTEVSNKLFR